MDFIRKSMSNNNIKKHFPIFQRLYTKFYSISFYLLNIWMFFGREEEKSHSRSNNIPSLAPNHLMCKPHIRVCVNEHERQQK